MKYKKIWKEDRFAVSEDCFLFEEKKAANGGIEYRQLQPTFESRFWEVYALHRENGLYYAVIAKHHEVREFYKKEIIFSRAGRFWLPIGRDLAVKAMGDSHWEILSRQNGRLVETTPQFVPFRNCLITHVEYQSPILSVVVKTPVGSQYEGKVYWKQEANGYAAIEEKDASLFAEEYLKLPEDPFYV